MNSQDLGLAMLESNLKAMRDLSGTSVAKLDKISRSNTQSIAQLTPLLNQIKTSRKLESDLDMVFGRIGHMQRYNDMTMEVLKRMDAVKKMDSVQEMQVYTDCIDQLDSVQREMKANKVKVFRGLREALDGAYEKGEVQLKRQLKKKLAELSQFQLNIVQGDGKESDLGDLMNQLKFIHGYLTQKRGLNVDDFIIQERVQNAMNNLEHIHPAMPDIGRDQNDIYVGKQGKPFEYYTNLVLQLMIQETNFIYGLFKSQNYSKRVLDVYLNGFQQGVNEIIGQISRRKISYCTLFFEISLGLDTITQWLKRHHIEAGESIQSLSNLAINESRNIFIDFFNYCSNLFQTSAKSANPSLSSEFNMILNRLKNFQLLTSEELHFIKLFTFQEWLPAGFPKSFKSLPSDQSDDPQLMLSTFYADVIIWAYHLLDDKYKDDVDSQKIGLMLLSNFETAQSMIQNGKLKMVLGQNGIDRISKLQKKALDKSVNMWNSLITETMRAATVTGAGTMMMSKAQAKEFTEYFNEELEKLCSKFKSSPPNEPYKGLILKEIEKTLYPAYSGFLMKVPPNVHVKHLMTVNEVKMKINTIR